MATSLAWYDELRLAQVVAAGFRSAGLEEAASWAVVDLVLSKPESYRGFVRQEQFRLPEVLANRFGAWYSGTDKSISGRIVVEGKAGRQRGRAGALR